MVPFFYVSDLDDSNEKKNFFRLKDRSNNITHTLSLHNLQPATRNEQSALPVPSHGHSQLDAVTHLKLKEAFVLFLNARFPLSECKFHLACRGASVQSTCLWCSKTGCANVWVALTFRGMHRGEDQINETRLTVFPQC